MSGLHEVDCGGCGRRHVTNGEQARKLRVLRCDCGYFVRLDRAVADRRSQPSPPPAFDLAKREDEEDATHLMSSATAAAVVNGRSRNRSQQPSLIDDERVSRPVQRPSSLSSAPPRQPSIAPTDKPLWYVDLGGNELIEMTIEQLILARRGGKLGEGALVWREGMPNWRPVGTLIPAASASSHPSPQASASATSTPSRPATSATSSPLPSRSPVPTRTPLPKPAPEDATPQSLASYERPLATLEFALDKAPSVAPPRAPFPSIDAAGAPGLRAPTPVPRSPRSTALSTPFPRPAPLPQVGSAGTATQSPLPRRSSVPPPAAAPVVKAAPAPLPAAPVARSSDRPQPLVQPSPETSDSLSLSDSFRERPRWVSACIALAVCITASAAGASLVRSLRQPQKPQVLLTSALPAPVATTTSQKQPIEPPPVASAPRVVAVESLSVEHKRPAPRYVRVAPKPAPAEPTEADDETTTPAKGTSAEAPAPEAAKTEELPAAARENPYGNGSLIDQIKRATAEEEASQ